ncbi:hypothetical protein B0H13DRAFT_1960671, partial [Mycena leptocephala]
ITMDRSRLLEVGCTGASDWRRCLDLDARVHAARQCRKGMNASLPIEGAYSFYSFTFYAVAPPFSRPRSESRGARTACARSLRRPRWPTADVHGLGAGVGRALAGACGYIYVGFVAVQMYRSCVALQLRGLGRKAGRGTSGCSAEKRACA